MLPLKNRLKLGLLAGVLACILLTPFAAMAINTGRAWLGGPIHDVYTGEFSDATNSGVNVNKLWFKGFGTGIDPTDSSRLIVRPAYSGDLNTTDTTTTTLTTVALPINTAVNILTSCIALQDDEAHAGGYNIEGTFRRGASTTVTAVGSTRILETANEDTGAWVGPSFAAGTGVVLMQVSGAAATNITWHCATNVVFVTSTI